MSDDITVVVEHKYGGKLYRAIWPDGYEYAMLDPVGEFLECAISERGRYFERVANKING